MSRNKLPVGRTPLTVRLPSDVYERTKEALTSQTIGAVPSGAWQALISRLLRIYLDSGVYDFGPKCGMPEGMLVVYGHPEVIKKLTELLEKENDK